MRGRRLRWVMVLAGLAVVVAASAVMLWPEPAQLTRQITRANCDRVKKRMTLAEVTEILGPPGDYTTGPVAWRPVDPLTYELLRPPPKPKQMLAHYEWIADTAKFDAIIVDPDGVQAYWFSPVTRPPQSPVELFVWWTKRQWRRWFP
jgi:hypothetical protein